MQGAVRYVRVIFDLFPDERQVCVAAVDYAKCQPVNSWRDEDQELGKVSTHLCHSGGGFLGRGAGGF